MFATTITGRPRGALAAAALAVMLAACGGPTASTGVTSAPASEPAPGASGEPAASAGYSGPPATIEYAIWGDPAEITSQTAIAQTFMDANPSITVNVSVSDWDAYWDKLQTGIAGGAAPDVFAMDGPLFPDYQSRDVLLDLKPFIDRDGYDLTQLADQGVADFTTEGGQYGLPRDLNVIALYYNKAKFDEAGVAVPRRHVGLGEARRRREAADQGHRRRRHHGPVGLLHRDHATWRTTGCPRSGRTAATSSPRRQVHGARHGRGRGRHPVHPGPDLEGQGHGRPGRVRRDRRRVRAGRGRHGRPTARGSCRRSQAAGIDFGIAPLPRGPAGRFTSVNPTGAVVYKGSKSPDAAWEFVKFLASPAAQEQLMQLKASLPVSKEVLAGPYATSFEGAQVFADSLEYAKLKPSFKGYNEFTTLLQGELDENVFNAANKTAKQALTDIVPQLDALLAGQ